eukprot:UN04681
MLVLASLFLLVCLACCIYRLKNRFMKENFKAKFDDFRSLTNLNMI